MAEIPTVFISFAGDQVHSVVGLDLYNALVAQSQEKDARIAELSSLVESKDATVAMLREKVEQKHDLCQRGEQLRCSLRKDADCLAVRVAQLRCKRRESDSPSRVAELERECAAFKRAFVIADEGLRAIASHEGQPFHTMANFALCVARSEVDFFGFDNPCSLKAP